MSSKGSFRFYLPGIHPADLPIGDLASLLEWVHSLMKPEARKPHGLNSVQPPEPVISLVGVHTGSCNLAFECDDEDMSREYFDQMADIVNNRSSSWTARKRSLDLLKLSKKLGTPIELYPGGSDSAVAKVTPDEEDVEPGCLLGETVVYGRLVRVGGRDPKVHVSTDRGLVIMDVTVPMARELAKRLYDEVGIRGLARWNPETWDLEDFRPVELIDYEPGPVLAAFDELADACGPNGWDHAEDVLASVLDLREGGGRI